MQIVINVDEVIYKRILPYKDLPIISNLCNDYPEITHAIANGVPIPKGHGDLKDESDLDLFAPNLGTDEYVDDLMAKHNIDYVNGDDEDKVRAFALDLIDSCMNVIKTAPTIIGKDDD